MRQRQKAPKKGAVIYTRVSTDEQVKNGSLRVQETESRRFCERHGYEVREVFRDEGAPAGSEDRPEFQRMLGYCHKHRNDIAAVVVWQFDRFSRNAEIHLAKKAVLLKIGVRVLSATQPVDDTPHGKFAETVLAASAQLENDAKSVATRLRMQEHLRRGSWMFQVPLGYEQRHQNITPNDVAPLVAEAFEMISTGVYSKRHVLKTLTKKGLRTKAGKVMGAQSFERMLRNRFYAGWACSPKLGIDERGHWPPLVTDEVFGRVEAVLDRRKLPTRPHQRFREEFPLRHFLRCSLCEKPLTASFHTGRKGKKYGYYSCRERCTKSFDIHGVEREFEALLARLAPDRSLLKV